MTKPSRSEAEELIIGLAKSLVKNPEELASGVHGTERMSIIALRASKEDTPILIGKKGSMVRAIKNVADQIQAHTGTFIKVNILEPTTEAPMDVIETEIWGPHQAAQKILEAVGIQAEVTTDGYSQNLLITIRQGGTKYPDPDGFGTIIHAIGKRRKIEAYVKWE